MHLLRSMLLIRCIKAQALCLLIAVLFACDQEQITGFNGDFRSENEPEKKFSFSDLEMSDKISGVRVLAKQAAMNSSGELSIKGVKVKTAVEGPDLPQDKAFNRLEINFKEGDWDLRSNMLTIHNELRFISEKGKTELKGLSIKLDPFKQMILCFNNCRLFAQNFALKSKKFEMSFKGEPVITASEIDGEFYFDKE